MFSMFGSGSVRPRKVFRILLAAARFEPNFENITRMERPSVGTPHVWFWGKIYNPSHTVF